MILADTLKKNKELFAENKIKLIDTAENKEVESVLRCPLHG